MYGSNRFVSVNQMRLDSHSETPGSSTAFEKTQPGRIATFLNSFIGPYGAAERPTTRQALQSWHWPFLAVRAQIRSWIPLAGFCTNVMIIGLPGQVAGREEQRTLQGKAPPGTRWHKVGTPQGVCLQFSFDGWRRGVLWEWSKGMGELCRTAPGATSPESHIPTTKRDEK